MAKSKQSQLTLFDAGFPPLTRPKRPTRLKSWNADLEATECNDLPYLLANVIVSELHPRRHEMLALRQTCKTMCGAIDECVDQLLATLNKEKAERCLGVESRRNVPIIGIHHSYPSSVHAAELADYDWESYRRFRITEILRQTIPSTRDELFPLLFECCCFCRRSRHRRNAYGRAVPIDTADVCKVPMIFGHEGCFAERVVLISDGTDPVQILGSRRRCIEIRREVLQCLKRRLDWREVLFPVDHRHDTIRFLWEEIKACRRIFVHPNPLVPDHMVLSRLLE